MPMEIGSVASSTIEALQDWSLQNELLRGGSRETCGAFDAADNSRETPAAAKWGSSKEIFAPHTFSQSAGWGNALHETGKETDKIFLQSTSNLGSTSHLPPWLLPANSQVEQVAADDSYQSISESLHLSPTPFRMSPRY